MKSNFIATMAVSALLLSSCSAQQLATYTGSTLGGAMGAVVGDRMGGWTGQVLGSAIGSVVGAAAGNTIATKSARQAQSNYRDDFYDNGCGTATSTTSKGVVVTDSRSKTYRQYYGAESSYSVRQIEISNVRFYDENGDNAVSPNETCEVSFEITNNGNCTAYELTPLVRCDDMKVKFSKKATIATLPAGGRVRYSTRFIANKVNNGSANFLVYIIDANGDDTDRVEFTLNTRK